MAILEIQQQMQHDGGGLSEWNLGHKLLFLVLETLNQYPAKVRFLVMNCSFTPTSCH